jgi:hypothetical protein
MYDFSLQQQKKNENDCFFSGTIPELSSIEKIQRECRRVSARFPWQIIAIEVIFTDVDLR